MLSDQSGEAQHTHLTWSLVRGVTQIVIDGSGDPNGGAVGVRFNRSLLVAAAQHAGNPDGVPCFGCVTKPGSLCVDHAVGRVGHEERVPQLTGAGQPLDRMSTRQREFAVAGWGGCVTHGIAAGKLQ